MKAITERCLAHNDHDIKTAQVETSRTAGVVVLIRSNPKVKWFIDINIVTTKCCLIVKETILKAGNAL